MSRRIRVTVFSLLFAAGTHLMAAPSDVETANIRRGNISLGGSITLDQVLESSTNAVSTFNTSLALQYFVIDHLGIGGAFSYNHASNTRDNSLLGPVLSYFFWEQRNLAAYVGASYSLGLTNATVTGRFNATIGANYFITPAVAVGPWLSFRHIIGRRGPTYDRILFGADFAIYL